MSDTVVSRAAFLEPPGRIVLRELRMPQPAAGEVLVRIEAALTCGTELKTIRRGHALLPAAGPFGHEASGSLVALGDGVQGFAPGDAVMWVPTAPCGMCELCSLGRENLCAVAVGRIVLGAYADHLLIPARIVERHLFPRPSGLLPEHAALLEPLACVVHGADRLEWTGAPRVVVIGDGAIALLFARVARLRGAGDVRVLGRHDERLDVARAFGADTLRAHDREGDDMRDIARADIVVECVGTPETWRLASTLARPGGTVLLFGDCAAGTAVAFDAARIHYEEVDHIGAFHYTPRAVREALRLLAGGGIDAARLITCPG